MIIQSFTLNNAIRQFDGRNKKFLQELPITKIYENHQKDVSQKIPNRWRKDPSVGGKSDQYAIKQI